MRECQISSWLKGVEGGVHFVWMPSNGAGPKASQREEGDALYVRKAALVLEKGDNH